MSNEPSDVAALVERLRLRTLQYNDRDGYYAYIGDDVALDEAAASALQAQAAEIARRGGLRDAVAELKGFGPDWPEHGNVPLAIAALFALEKRRAEAAEAKLWEAVEVLREIAYSDDIDNALDPERNKRIARTFLSSMEQTNADA